MPIDPHGSEPVYIRIRTQTPTNRAKLPCEKFGGAERDRTVDLCVANASLSQLSYSPMMQI